MPVHIITQCQRQESTVKEEKREGKESQKQQLAHVMPLQVFRCGISFLDMKKIVGRRALPPPLATRLTWTYRNPSHKLPAEALSVLLE